MAKPSATNIQPPSQTTVWTPPTTTWVLDNSTQWSEAENTLKTAADHGDTSFDSLVGKINLPVSHALDGVDLKTYDYVFFGVNGGLNETVTGKVGASGVIVTGDGMDTITGGSKGDVIFAGNAKDIVHGGGGNDIIFGENGTDQLFGDADGGTAALSQSQVVGSGQHFWDANPTTLNNTDATLLSGSPTYQAQQQGFYNDGTTIWRVFSFDNPSDTTETVNYSQDNQIQNDTGVVAGSFTAYAHHVNYFLVKDSSLTDQGRIAITFVDNEPPHTGPDEIDRNHIPLQVESGELTFSFHAGDQLIGGNGGDTFIYNLKDGPNNVDLILDYNQSLGYLNPLEGDVLVLKNATASDISQVLQGQDLGNGQTGLVIYFSQNHAVGLVGINDIADVTIQYA